MRVRVEKFHHRVEDLRLRRVIVRVRARVRVRIRGFEALQRERLVVSE